jgi:hypothetical protein
MVGIVLHQKNAPRSDEQSKSFFPISGVRKLCCTDIQSKTDTRKVTVLVSGRDPPSGKRE